MKTQIFNIEEQMDLAAANCDYLQLELDLQQRPGAKILSFAPHQPKSVPDQDEVSRRLLDFAATLPDW